MSSNSVNEID